MKEQKWKEERQYRDTTAVKIKTWGDALRNTITKMPNESIEIVSWFVSVEKLFEQLAVPKELQQVLIRPYLSDRAKILLSKCDSTHSATFDSIKKFLLKELHLSPSVYLDKFTTLAHDQNETYNQYSTRLSALFDYYLESRKVEKSYEKVVELIIYDRVKSCLPQYVARHILALEVAHKDGWLGRLPLAEALVAYIANAQHSNYPKPSGQQQKNNNAPTNGDKPPVGKTEQQKPTPVPRTGPGRRCYVCNASDHISPNCSKNTGGGFKKPEVKPRVNACVAETPIHMGEKITSHVNRAEVHDTECTLENTDVKSVGHQNSPLLIHEQVVDTDTKPAVNHMALDEGSELSDDGSCVPSCDLPVQRNPVDDIGEGPYDPLLADGWSHLRYVGVNIDGLQNELTALNDSGCQLCVVRSDVIQPLDLPKLGEAKLKGLSCEVVPADIVRLRMRLSNGRAFSNVTCAVVNNLNHDLILGSDIVEKLNARMIEENFDVNNVINLDEPDIDDVDNDAHNNDVSVVTDILSHDVNDDDVIDDGHIANDDDDDKPDDDNALNCDPRKASADTLRTEQRTDKSLAGCWSLAERHKAGYFVHHGILYRRQNMLGHEYEQLVLPYGRRAEVIKLAHEVHGGHLASKKTKERIKLSFTWPTIAADVQKACEVCHQCQKRRRATVYDRVPISPIPRDEVPFNCLVMDCMGPLFSSQKVEYNYALVICDSNTRYPFCYPLRSLSAKNVCNALLEVFQMVGIPTTIRSDCGSNFTSKLTTTFLQMLCCSPNFNVPGRPQQTGLRERLIGTLKSMISKVAADNPRSWHKHVGFLLWSLREIPNSTTGLPPWLLAFSRLPRGPLAVLQDTMTGKVELPLNLGKTASEYLNELRKNLEVAQQYAASHSQKAQQRYISRYNLRAREKSFEIGQRVLVLMPDSTSSKVFSRWQGPGIIKDKKSAHSYLVDINSSVKHIHADKLRKYHVAVDELVCETVSSGHIQTKINHCAVIYDDDGDFGDIGILENPNENTEVKDEPLPSQQVDLNSLSHLTAEQQTRLLALLDKYHECFSSKPGFCSLVEHEIHVSDDFRPKRLRAYRVPENLKPAVEEQIQE